MYAHTSQDIAGVYAFRQDVPAARVGWLLLLWIGPGEDLFWRGYLQEQWMQRWGRWPGWLAATALYAGVHVLTGNVTLLLAAAVCGTYWGWLYLWRRSLGSNMVSHAVWDVTVFLLLPFTT